MEYGLEKYKYIVYNRYVKQKRGKVEKRERPRTPYTKEELINSLLEFREGKFITGFSKKDNGGTVLRVLHGFVERENKANGTKITSEDWVERDMPGFELKISITRSEIISRLKDSSENFEIKNLANRNSATYRAFNGFIKRENRQRGTAYTRGTWLEEYMPEYLMYEDGVTTKSEVIARLNAIAEKKMVVDEVNGSKTEMNVITDVSKKDPTIMRTLTNFVDRENEANGTALTREEWVEKNMPGYVLVFKVTCSVDRDELIERLQDVSDKNKVIRKLGARNPSLLALLGRFVARENLKNGTMRTREEWVAKNMTGYTMEIKKSFKSEEAFLEFLNGKADKDGCIDVIRELPEYTSLRYYGWDVSKMTNSEYIKQKTNLHFSRAFEQVDYMEEVRRLILGKHPDAEHYLDYKMLVEAGAYHKAWYVKEHFPGGSLENMGDALAELGFLNYEGHVCSPKYTEEYILELLSERFPDRNVRISNIVNGKTEIDDEVRYAVYKLSGYYDEAPAEILEKKGFSYDRGKVSTRKRLYLKLKTVTPESFSTEEKDK